MSASLRSAIFFLLSSSPALASAQLVLTDVLVQARDGKVQVGSAQVDESSGNALTVDLSTRVFGATLQSNFRTSNPGFNSTATGSPVLPAGVTGFGAGVDVEFDLLPITTEEVVSTILYWDGLGAEVSFSPPPSNVVFGFRDNDGATAIADGGDQLVPGGLIQTTTSSGTLHMHRPFAIDDGDGQVGTTAADGIYLTSLHLRVDGFEESDPVFFTHRSQSIGDTVFTQAAAWVQDNYDLLIGLLPGDFNADGFVDAADYTVWRDNADGSFVAEDYQIWADNYGLNETTLSAGMSAISVPEPATLTATLLALSLLECGSRRNRAA